MCKTSGNKPGPRFHSTTIHYHDLPRCRKLWDLEPSRFFLNLVVDMVTVDVDSRTSQEKKKNLKNVIIN